MKSKKIFILGLIAIFGINFFAVNAMEDRNPFKDTRPLKKHKSKDGNHPEYNSSEEQLRTDLNKILEKERQEKENRILDTKIFISEVIEIASKLESKAILKQLKTNLTINAFLACPIRDLVKSTLTNHFINKIIAFLDNLNQESNGILFKKLHEKYYKFVEDFWLFSNFEIKNLTFEFHDKYEKNIYNNNLKTHPLKAIQTIQNFMKENKTNENFWSSFLKSLVINKNTPILINYFIDIKGLSPNNYSNKKTFKKSKKMLHGAAIFGYYNVAKFALEKIQLKYGKDFLKEYLCQNTKTPIHEIVSIINNYNREERLQKHLTFIKLFSNFISKTYGKNFATKYLNIKTTNMGEIYKNHTPLMLATHKDESEIIKVLLDCGASPLTKAEQITIDNNKQEE